METIDIDIYNAHEHILITITNYQFKIAAICHTDGKIYSEESILDLMIFNDAILICLRMRCSLAMSQNLGQIVF